MNVFYSVETAIPSDSDSATEITTRFFVAPNIKVPGILKKMAMLNNRQILKEDADLVNKWAEHYLPGAGTAGWLPGEERIAAYVEWLESRGVIF